MKRKLIVVSMALAACAMPVAYAEEAPAASAVVEPAAEPASTVTAEQLDALEARLADMETRSSVAPATAGFSDRIKVNGFMSAGFGMADIENFTYDNLSEHPSQTTDAVVGLQVDGKVNDKVNAVIQLVGRGNSNFDVNAEWAYVGVRPTSADEIRFGRLRTSFYMLSEYLEVGYAYPWVRPPTEVYQPGFPSSYDGIAWLHKFNTGSWQHDLQLNWGNTKSPPGSSTPLDAEDGWGVSWVSTHNNLQLGAKMAGSKLTSNTALFNGLSQVHNAPGGNALVPVDTKIDRNDILYASLGLQYDDGAWLVLAESTLSKVDGWLADTESSYVTVGHRFGKWMPHLTYALSRSPDDDDRPNINGAALCGLPTPVCLATSPVSIPLPDDLLSRLSGSEVDTVTLGVRYDLLPNVAAKLDWMRVLDMHGTFGGFISEGAARNLTPNFPAPGYVTPPDDPVDIFRFAVDVVF